MKKQPLDSLTPQDRYNIRKYIELYGPAVCGPLDIVLGYWNNSKRRLYHAFGNQLRVKKKINIVRTESMIEVDLKNVYIPRFLTSYGISQVLTDSSLEDENFINSFLYFVSKKEDINANEKLLISTIFAFINTSKGVISNIDELKLTNYNFTCKKGMKTIRTIQKCLKALKYPYMEKFYEWRDKVNLVDKKLNKEVNLVLSIHPLDFMTMSDNNCNWSSCMSWINDGCYHAGTLEMMNSNVAVVTYLEHPNTFNIALDDEETISIPNKMWRQLLYVSKDFILTGKSYPFNYDAVSIEVMTFMREMVEQKFHWSYKYINQVYRDIKNYYSNNFLKNVAESNRYNKHKIIIYTNGMYNDMIEDTSRRYWCCRNKTQLRLNLSGPTTCVCCGNVMEDKYCSSPEDIGRDKLCYNCCQSACEKCGKVVYNSPYKYKNYTFCSKECAEESLYFNIDGQDIIISKEDFICNSGRKIFIVGKDIQTTRKISLIMTNDIIRENVDSLNIVKVVSQANKVLESKGFIKGKDYIIKVIPTTVLKYFSFYQHRLQNCFYKFASVYVVSNVIRKRASYIYLNKPKVYVLNKGILFENFSSKNLINVLTKIEQDKKIGG